MDTNLIIAVIISSAAGWYAGFYIERSKGIQMYVRLMNDSRTATSQLTSAAVSLLRQRTPEKSVHEVVQEFVEETRKFGMKIKVTEVSADDNSN